jgi:hypothetical protein
VIGLFVKISVCAPTTPMHARILSCACKCNGPLMASVAFVVTVTFLFPALSKNPID